jgi:hypothetical protein
MDHLPFKIKVEAVIIRANGTQENLGTIGSTALREENEHGIDINNS